MPDYEVEDCGWRTARIVHRCEDCERDIVKGERYYYEREPWYETGKTHKTCAKCHAKRGGKDAL